MTRQAQSFCHWTTPRTRHNNSQEQNGNSTWRTSTSESHYHRSGQKGVIACWVLVAKTGTYCAILLERNPTIDSLRICQQLWDSKCDFVAEKFLIDIHIKSATPWLEHACSSRTLSAGIVILHSDLGFSVLAALAIYRPSLSWDKPSH